MIPSVSVRSLLLVVIFALAGCKALFPFSPTKGDEVSDGGSGTDAAADGPLEQGFVLDGLETDSSVSTTGGLVVWVKAVGGEQIAEIRGMDVSATTGDCYLTGFFSGEISIGDCTQLAPGAEEALQILVAALDSSDGSCKWSDGYGGNSEDKGRAIVASDDGIFIAGTFVGTLEVGNFSLNSRGGGDIFVAKLSPDGLPLGLAGVGGEGSDGVGDITTVSDGGVIITGWFDSSQLEIGNGGVLFLGGSTIAGFVARFENTLDATWGISISGQGHLLSNGVATDGSAVFVAGYYSGKAALEGHELPSTGGATKETFVAKLMGEDGAVSWAHNPGNIPFWDTAADVAWLPTTGQIVTAGLLDLPAGTECTLGQQKVTGAGGKDAVLIRFDTASQQFVAVSSVAGPKDDEAVAVATDTRGNIYAAGHFRDVAVADGVTLTSAEHSQSVFVVSYSSDGTLRWARSFGGGQTTASAIAVEGDYVYVAGQFVGEARFGDERLTAVGTQDGFLLKLRAD